MDIDIKVYQIVIIENVHFVNVDGSCLRVTQQITPQNGYNLGVNTFLRVVEALDEVDDGALAAAAAADERHGLAGGQLCVQAVEDLDFGAGGVVEVHVLELNVAFDSVGRDEAAVVVDLGPPAGLVRQEHKGVWLVF